MPAPCSSWRKGASEGCSRMRAAPCCPSRAARPTRWTYSLGSGGRSYCTIQCTPCRLRPRAATSVHRSTPLSAERKELKAAARCFLSMLPCSRSSFDPSSTESTTASDGGAAVIASTSAAAAAAAAASRSSSLAGAWPAVIFASCSLGQLPPPSLPPPS
eukprot:scaffold53114_cov64-Phaeocystis_antarctica.AAC.1